VPAGPKQTCCFEKLGLTPKIGTDRKEHGNQTWRPRRQVPSGRVQRLTAGDCSSNPRPMGWREPLVANLPASVSLHSTTRHQSSPVKKRPTHLTAAPPKPFNNLAIPSQRIRRPWSIVGARNKRSRAIMLVRHCTAGVPAAWEEVRVSAVLLLRVVAWWCVAQE